MANTPIDIFDFLDELAKFIAAAAVVVYTPNGDAPRQLFRVQAPEDDATPIAATYSVLTPYRGGSVPFVPTLSLPIQCKTTGENNAAGFAASHALYATLFNAGKTPLRNVTLGAPAKFRLLGIKNLQPPGLVGRDSKQRPEIVFNFDASAVPLT